MRALAEGNKAKATGETLMNRDSSRSHCIFTIFVETAVKASNVSLTRYLNQNILSQLKSTNNE